MYIPSLRTIASAVQVLFRVLNNLTDCGDGISEGRDFSRMTLRRLHWAIGPGIQVILRLLSKNVRDFSVATTNGIISGGMLNIPNFITDSKMI
jgi:hypothetical protein